MHQIVPDNYLYARVALVVKDKSSLSEERLPELAEVLADEVKAQEARCTNTVAPLTRMNTSAILAWKAHRAYGAYRAYRWQAYHTLHTAHLMCHILRTHNTPPPAPRVPLTAFV